MKRHNVKGHKTMRIAVEEHYDIDIPEVPAHLRATGGKRASIPIGELPVDVLRQIGKAWTDALIFAAHPEPSASAEQPAEPVSE